MFKKHITPCTVVITSLLVRDKPLEAHLWNQSIHIWLPNDAQSLKQPRNVPYCFFKVICEISRSHKANLGDLIAATGLVIFLKFDSNHRFFCLCDLEIWWMTLKNNKAPLLYSSHGLVVKSPYHTSMVWSSVWHRSNTGISSTQYEQIPIILGVWPFWLTPFFFRQ